MPSIVEWLSGNQQRLSDDFETSSEGTGTKPDPGDDTNPFAKPKPQTP